MSQLETISREIFDQVRTTIVLNMRFMDMAVFRLKPVAAPVTLATDGKYLYYHPLWLLKRYRGEANAVTRDYLHVLLHCVFRHPFIDTLVDRQRWDLAADIAVEAVIASLELPRFEAGRELDQWPVIDALTDRLGLLTAEKLYHYFQDNPPPEEWFPLFLADDHALWHMPRQRGGAKGRRRDGDGPDGGDSAGGGRPPEPSEPDQERQLSQVGESDALAGEDQASDDARSQARESADGPDSLAAEGDGPNGDDERTRSLRADPGGESGRSLLRREDGDSSASPSGGEGLDTQGGDTANPSGTQSRNRRTGNGVDSPGSSGSGGDSADASPGGDRSSSGGSGSGLSDARVDGEADGGDALAATRPDRPDDDSRDALKREWRDVSEHIQMALESQAHQRGSHAGSLQRQLELGNREQYDYAAFLRKFAVLGEHMQLNDDEFDQIFYTYGLKLYGNLPLIEPQETKEVRRIRDFVIAIDTSASTSGELVEEFLTRTWEVLSSEESFFRKLRLVIIQCDAQVQESAFIASREDFERYMGGFTVKGLGGTDFRPVFRYVDELRRQGAFLHLRGLIYFTDGKGVYPERKPDYETAFVFVERPDADAPDVPAWAIKLVLNEGELS